MSLMDKLKAMFSGSPDSHDHSHDGPDHNHDGHDHAHDHPVASEDVPTPARRDDTSS